jgi:Fe-S-cluster-containing dehydrogenase component/formate-dependent nitrite reductase membrane component NrfD
MRYGFVIDQDRCIGCHACTVACKEEHQVPVGVFRTWVKYVEKGEFPHTSRHFGVMRCNHCDAAPCIEICPTNALYHRSDGIVDFDNRRCIGCKGCMQACPYDALYIDPNNNTAAKCNFCAHRVENNQEPACVIVCPTQAIIAGDLDNPSSKASRMVATEKVSVRKPQKGTEPKLYYLGIEGDLLQPTRLSHQNTYMFAEQRDQRPSSSGFDPAVTREVYDVAHPAPWGWKIAAYLWTKSIAAGVLLMAAIYMGLSTTVNGQLLNVLSPLIALAALAVTSALLIFDLKRPDRFFYLLTKPNFRSWLVIGGYILIGYGGLSSTWLLLGVLGQTIPGALVFTTALLASATACYSAFLFAQAKGRDLWQSPMFFWHLLMHALIAGSATLALVGFVTNHLILMNDSVQILVPFLVISLLMVLAEVALPHVSIDSQLAMRALIRGHLRMRFWGLVVGAGLVLPIVLGIFSAWDSIWTIPVPVLALAGVWWFQDLWVKAGQSVPLS